MIWFMAGSLIKFPANVPASQSGRSEAGPVFLARCLQVTAYPLPGGQGRDEAAETDKVDNDDQQNKGGQRKIVLDNIQLTCVDHMKQQEDQRRDTSQQRSDLHRCPSRMGPVFSIFRCCAAPRLGHGQAISPKATLT